MFEELWRLSPFSLLICLQVLPLCQTTESITQAKQIQLKTCRDDAYSLCSCKLIDCVLFIFSIFYSDKDVYHCRWRVAKCRHKLGAYGFWAGTKNKVASCVCWKWNQNVLRALDNNTKHTQKTRTRKQKWWSESLEHQRRGKGVDMSPRWFEVEKQKKKLMSVLYIYITAKKN